MEIPCATRFGKEGQICFLVSNIFLLLSRIKCNVTGENTCMVLKPLNNDKIFKSTISPCCLWRLIICYTLIG